MRHAELYRALWTRIEQVLGDGQWHNYEQVIVEVGKVIPPGVAIRKSEQERREKGGPPVRVQARDVERQIETGRRAMVRVVFKNRRFQFDRPGHAGRRITQRRVRLRETGRTWHGGCPANPGGHDDQLVIGPRGGERWVCRHCGRMYRESRHRTKET